MKKIILSLIAILGINATNAATLPTGTSGGYYRNTNTRNYNTNRTNAYYRNAKNNNRNIAHDNNNSHPTRFYLSAKGGYNLMFGSIYTDEDDNAGFNFSTGTPILSGALGVDFNRDPSLRLELEITNVPASKAKFSDGWDSNLHADVGYTSYMLNFIPYFKMANNTNIYLTFGLGAASIDFTDTDSDDYLYLKSAKIAFSANFGVGLDISLTNNFSILPEVQYNLLATTIKHGLANIYIGYVESKPQTFVMHNCQFMLGAKYTF